MFQKTSGGSCPEYEPPPANPLVGQHQLPHQQGYELAPAAHHQQLTHQDYVEEQDDHQTVYDDVHQQPEPEGQQIPTDTHNLSPPPRPFGTAPLSADQKVTIPPAHLTPLLPPAGPKRKKKKKRRDKLSQPPMEDIGPPQQRSYVAPMQPPSAIHSPPPLQGAPPIHSPPPQGHNQGQGGPMPVPRPRERSPQRKPPHATDQGHGQMQPNQSLRPTTLKAPPKGKRGHGPPPGQHQHEQR